MRLINSDGQIVNAKTQATAPGSSANSFRFELGGLAVVAGLCVMLVTVGFAVWALVDSHATRDLVAVQQQAWERSFDQQQAQARRTETEARVAINEYMQFKAKEK